MRNLICYGGGHSLEVRILSGCREFIQMKFRQEPLECGVPAEAGRPDH